MEIVCKLSLWSTKKSVKNCHQDAIKQNIKPKFHNRLHMGRSDMVALVGTSTHVARSINRCCAFHRTRAFVASSAICDVLRVSRRPDEWTALRWRVSVWILPKFVLAVRSFSSSGQSLNMLNWQSSQVCSIFCVWMSALLLSVFLFELRKLEGLPTERCSTESQALRRGGRRWKDFCLWTRGGLPLLTTLRNLLGELAQCSLLLVAWAFHADGQRDRDDGDRGKST